jgi:hypothetical protein
MPHLISHTNRTVAVQISRRQEVLHMNAAAVWITISILAWLIFTTGVVTALRTGHLHHLVRNVQCLGDILVLIAKSEKFLLIMLQMQNRELEDRHLHNVRTHLGWFTDCDKQRRWGIEVADIFLDALEDWHHYTPLPDAETSINGAGMTSTGESRCSPPDNTESAALPRSDA